MAKAIKTGLMNALNDARTTASDTFKKAVPEITANMDISEYGKPILDYTVIQNEWFGVLINRIVTTQIQRKMFMNPLKFLEGSNMPLGYSVQDIAVNPAKGRNFDANDFEGILKRYDADIKVQYFNINKDRQYPVSVNNRLLHRAFTTWDNLDEFLTAISDSLYNGAFIEEFNFTKNLVSSAYNNNAVIIEQIDEVSDADKAKQFVRLARTYFLNFQLPSSNYNAWNKVGGNGMKFKTWTNSSDVVFLIRNDILSYIDVEVLASAFNIDKSTLMGNIKGIDNFDIIDPDTEEKIFDGSAIYGIMADRSWFKIKTQDMWLDTQYIASNRVWQYFLNNIKMYNFSYLANAIIFATSLPTVSATAINLNPTDRQLTKEVQKTYSVVLTPYQSTDTVSVKSVKYNSSDVSTNVTAEIDVKNLNITVKTAYENPSVDIELEAGTVTQVFTFNVNS